MELWLDVLPRDVELINQPNGDEAGTLLLLFKKYDIAVLFAGISIDPAQLEITLKFEYDVIFNPGDIEITQEIVDYIGAKLVDCVVNSFIPE